MDGLKYSKSVPNLIDTTVTNFDLWWRGEGGGILKILFSFLVHLFSFVEVKSRFSETS